MKFSLSWLKQHLDTTASLEVITETLTRLGLEVEHVSDPAQALAPFLIARVISADPHPNADRLRVCQVDTGQGPPVQVVCGAPNARAGMISVFAAPGTVIPVKGTALSTGTIRGVDSLGMLCSAQELQISDDHDGIMDLPADAPVGLSYASYAALADEAVIDINLTPNRPDCTGVHGIARDLAAAGLGTLKDSPVKPITGGFPCPVRVSIESDACPAFALRLVKGVRNGPSPDWLQKRLVSIGLRPINALVDITNYMTFDRGRPLHVFDAAKIQGDLVVRQARAGEQLAALDGKSYVLDPSMCVIADAHGVESLAGIMGGQASGCDESTQDVLIESALWDALSIARTGRALGLHSDARYRFERGVDPHFMRPGLEMATQLVLDLCGGTASDVEMAGSLPSDDRLYELCWRDVRQLAGLEAPVPEMKVALTSLGFFVSGTGECVKVSPPSWRPDIQGKADLIEEIVRLLGVDRIAAVPFSCTDSGLRPVLTPLQTRSRKVRRSLAARGMVEAVTWSFISHAEASAFGGGAEALSLLNPIASDLSDMRPSLLPGLLKAMQRNVNRSLDNLALFEVGQVFFGARPQDQKLAAAGVRRGLTGGRHWQGAQDSSVYDVKADILAAIAACGVSVSSLQLVTPGPNWCHPGRSGQFQLGPRQKLGWFGELHPATLEALDVDGPAVGFELFLDVLPAAKPKATRARSKLELSDLQSVTRDFAFVVKEETPAGEVVKTIAAVDKTLIQDVSLFDVYRGKGVADGHKSLAVATTLQPFGKTLTDQEIDDLSQKIVATVSSRFGANLRSS